VTGSLYRMGNSKCKERSEITNEAVLSHEERHCLHRMFKSICHDHPACNKEDLRVSFKLWYYD
jgi:hypothetical protein